MGEGQSTISDTVSLIYKIVYERTSDLDCVRKLHLLKVQLPIFMIEILGSSVRKPKLVGIRR